MIDGGYIWSATAAGLYIQDQFHFIQAYFVRATNATGANREVTVLAYCLNG